MDFAPQFDELARALADVPDELRDSKEDLFEEWGEFMQDVHVARLEEGLEPDGSKVKPLSELTLALYSETGVGRTKPGGPGLLAGLKRGGAGNVFAVTENGIEYANELKAPSGDFVVETWQTRFFMPKDAADVEARRSIQGFFRKHLGITAPSDSKKPSAQLEHPARQLMGLEGAHVSQLASLTRLWVERSWDALGRRVD